MKNIEYKYYKIEKGMMKYHTFMLVLLILWLLGDLSRIMTFHPLVSVVAIGEAVLTVRAFFGLKKLQWNGFQCLMGVFGLRLAIILLYSINFVDLIGSGVSYSFPDVIITALWTWLTYRYYMHRRPIFDPFDEEIPKREENLATDTAKSVDEIFIPIEAENPAKDLTCSYCGSKVKEGDNYCENCGAKLKE